MIESINIKNFKSIRDAAIHLSNQSVIVGENAVGKSNILNAIFLLKNLIANQTLDEAVERFSTADDLFYFNSIDKDATIEITININEIKYQYIATFSLINKEIGSRNLIVKYEQLKEIGLNESIFVREDGILKDKEGNKVPLDIEQNKLALALYKDEKLIPLKSFFKNLRFCDFDISKLSQSINFIEDSLSALLVKLRHNEPEAYTQFQLIVSKMMPAFASIVEVGLNIPKEAKPDQQYYFVLLEEKNLKGRLSMQSISSGDLRTLFIMATALGMKNNSTLIIEEIENGMHPHRVRDILQKLHSISGKKDLQLIFTTHSPLVIDMVPPRNVILVSKNYEVGTIFTSLDDSVEAGKITKFLEKGGLVTEYLERLKYNNHS